MYIIDNDRAEGALELIDCKTLIARTRVVYIKFGECGEFLCGKLFPTEIVYTSYVRSGICMGVMMYTDREDEIGI